MFFTARGLRVNYRSIFKNLTAVVRKYWTAVLDAFATGRPTGMFSTTYKNSFTRQPTKARKNIYRVAIANNNTILDLHRQAPHVSARNSFCGLDLP
jgi:hypothetical protein